MILFRIGSHINDGTCWIQICLGNNLLFINWQGFPVSCNNLFQLLQYPIGVTGVKYCKPLNGYFLR